MYAKFILFILIIMAAPAFAATLNVTTNSVAPAFTNNNGTVQILNITLNAQGGKLNITQLNITIKNTGSVDIADVRIINGSSAGNQIGSNSSFNAVDNVTTIVFSPAFEVSDLNNTNMTVFVNISGSATSGHTFIVNISGTANITVNSGHTVSTLLGPESTATQIQSVHARATLTPHYADTNILNQSFVFNLTQLGTDKFNNLTVVMPSGYTIKNVTYIADGATTLKNSTYTNSSLFVGWVANTIYLNFSTYGTSFASVTINFTANTSSATTSAVAINATMTGSNLTNASTSIENDATNLTTKQLITISNVNIIKGAAIVNDTDYWEFNLTLDITESIGGIIQFRMNDWTSQLYGANRLNLTNQSTLGSTTRYYASLRNESSMSDSQLQIVNITSNYDGTTGGLTRTHDGNLFSLILRMIIPAGTPQDDHWSTTYFLAMRSNP